MQKIIHIPIDMFCYFEFLNREVQIVGNWCLKVYTALMGIASSLFYSSNIDKQTLHRRIIPTDEQQQSQQERWGDLAEYLLADLIEASGRNVTTWLQGSYKFATQIRPPKGEEFDIDLGVYYDWSGNPSQGNYTAAELKLLTQGILDGYANDVGGEVIEVVSPAKNRCSRIRFTGDFHIDVPSYHNDTDKNKSSLATEENGWEDSDPVAIYEWFKSQFSDDNNGQLRRLIRYAKMWSALNFSIEERPSSIIITVLVSDAFANLSSSEVDGDDLAFKNCIQKILDRIAINSVINNPVNASENLNRLLPEFFNNFIDKLNNLLNVSNRAVNAQNELESAAIWQEAFKHFFPIPVVQGQNASLAIVSVQFVPDVSVEAVSKDNANFRYTGHNQIQVPKNSAIRFIITNASGIPAGSTIEWVVRNEGKDAEIENDMGHMAGTSLIGKESSAYKGIHFMDLAIKSPYGAIIGFRRIPVTVTGLSIPPRNPKKKPGYLRFNRRGR
jgi:Adenylyl/Guanylyl and SMODS C-terminal sensor domain